MFKKERKDDNLEDGQLKSKRCRIQMFQSSWIVVAIVFQYLIQFCQAQQQLVGQRSFIFIEKYHFPVIPTTCQEYLESAMIANQTDFRTNIFFERFIIFQAVKKVIGDDAIISFECKYSMEGDNSDDPQNNYAGKFGSNPLFYLEDDNYFMSIPSLHYENFYIQKRNLKKVASQNMFEYLNYLFYLGIFLIPAITGIILFLFKDLTTFYDYQKVVYSVFRYFNRQGDQQMTLWMHKILALIVAIFFFFHYSILLSEMTAIRRFSLETEDVNKDSYKQMQYSSIQINDSLPKYYFLSVDSFQYHFIENDYELNEEFTDPTINHYNVQFNKMHFTLSEYNLLTREMLRMAAQHQSQNDIVLKNKFNIRSDDIYYNWIILGVAFLTGFIFKLLQLRFSSLNSYTEIKSYREQCNQNVTIFFGEMFRYYISQFLANIQAKDHILNFKQVPISNKCMLLGKQIFKLIEKRRKRNKFRRKKLHARTLNPENIVKAKQNLYQVIKDYIDLEKKGKLLHNHSKIITRRHAIQATIRKNPFSTTNDQLQPISQYSSSQVYSSNFNPKNEKKPTLYIQTSFNSVNTKTKGARMSIGNRLSSFNKLGKNNFVRRLSNIVLSADIPQDSPQPVRQIKHIIEQNKQRNGSRYSSPKNSNSNTDANNFLGFTQNLAQSSFLLQDNSSKNRRRGTNNILNPLQLQSLRKYDEDLTRKHNRRHSSYVEKKSGKENNDEEENQDNEADEGDHNQIEHTNGNEYHESEVQQTNENDYHQDQHTDDDGKEHHFNENEHDFNENNHKISEKKNNFNEKEIRQKIQSPNAQSSSMQTFRTESQSQADYKLTNRFLDSNRIELLLTEEKTNQDFKTSENDNQPTNNGSRFLKTSPNQKDSSLLHNFNRDLLFTEDDLLTDIHINKLQNLESYQSEFQKTPMKNNNTPSPFNGFHK